VPSATLKVHACASQRLVQRTPPSLQQELVGTKKKTFTKAGKYWTDYLSKKSIENNSSKVVRYCKSIHAIVYNQSRLIKLRQKNANVMKIELNDSSIEDKVK